MTWSATLLPWRRGAHDTPPVGGTLPVAAWALVGPAEIRAARRRRALRILRARLRRPLRVVVALAAVVVLARAVTTPSPAPSPGPAVTVWVAARDLTAGARLQPRDLREQRFPDALVPAGAWRRPRSGVLAGPVLRGEILTDGRLVADGVLSGAAAGTVAITFPIPSALAAVVRPGDRLRLVAAGSSGGGAGAGGDLAEAPASSGRSATPAPLQEDAVVLASPSRSAASAQAGESGADETSAGADGDTSPGIGDWWGGSGGGSPSAPAAGADDPSGLVAVLLGVDEADAPRLAAWDPARVLVVVLPRTTTPAAPHGR